MSLIVSRSLTYLTLFMYLAVGTMAARFLFPEESSIRINPQYFSVFTETTIPDVEISPVELPELAFKEIQFPLESAPVLAKIEAKKETITALKKTIKTQKVVVAEKRVVASFELPFFEPVKVEPVYFEGLLLNNLLALYKDLEVETKTFIAEFERTAIPVAPDAPASNVIASKADVSSAVKDEVSTVAAKSLVTTSENAEPEFFEYPTEVIAAESAVVLSGASEPVAAINNVNAVSPLAADVKGPSSSVASVNNDAVTISRAASPAKVEEVAVDDLLVFDYSAANRAIAQNQIPTVSAAKNNVVAPPSNNQQQEVESAGQKSKSDEKSLGGDVNHPAHVEKNNLFIKKPIEAQVTIQATGTNFKSLQNLSAFEVRFQDDLNEILEDYGTGEVVLKTKLNETKMTRSAVMLKRGYAPTNSEIIVEKGVVTLSLPLIQEEVFDELMEPYKSKGSLGAVLVELDDETETVELDMPYAKTIYLDGDLKKTSGGDYRYQLFIGVQAGNALLSYKDAKGQAVSKIVHVHEREVTFEANYYEKVQHNVVKLYEEDLLSKDKAPLIIASEQVKQFATDKTAKKIDDHTYKVNFGQGLLGGRQYLELNHLEEPTFVGFRENALIDVPSENFMRFILSRFEGSKLGNRCLVQVNLKKKADKLEVNAESLDSAVVTFTQMLDSDGRFYDSIGEKTRKIIIVGENQGSPDADQNAKINMKITYQDGTSQYLGSYCSPNSYLVEQL